MNAQTKVVPDYSRSPTRAEWERDTRLRDIRELHDRLRQRLAAKMAMLESRVHRDFDAGRLGR